MAIMRFFNKTATVSRMVVTPAQDAIPATEETPAVPAVMYKQERAETGDITGHLQQASAELAEEMGIKRTLAYLFWCSINADIKIDDTLEIDDINYTVVGVQSNDYGVNQHCECVLRLNQ